MKTIPAIPAVPTSTLPPPPAIPFYRDWKLLLNITGIIAIVVVAVLILALIIRTWFPPSPLTIPVAVTKYGIPDLTSATNGFYRSLGTYQAERRKWVAILQPVVITKIDTATKKVGTANVGEFPILLTLDYPLANPSDTNGQFSGLVEIGTYDVTKRFIREYHYPFAELPEKK